VSSKVIGYFGLGKRFAIRLGKRVRILSFSGLNINGISKSGISLILTIVI
jgi:hypothetical protein